MTFVHKSDTARFFVVTYQEKQGNKIEVKIEKVKKVPGLIATGPPTIMKYIDMTESELRLDAFLDFTQAPWNPESAQIVTFKEFIKKEIVGASSGQSLGAQA